MTLRIKIYAILGVVVLLGYLALLGGMASRDHAQRVASAERAARLMVAQADAADHYTRQEITPLLDNVMHDSVVFIPQSAGFYAVETEGRMIGQSLEGYRLRRVVLDPTGPADTPDAWERDAIMRLRGDDSATPFVEMRGNNTLSLVAPLKMQNGVCATCYTSRDAAPVSVRDAFGSAHGFDRRPGEVVGATIATVPLPPAASFFGSTALIAAAVMAGCWIVACLLVELLVLRPILRMADLAEQVSLGAHGVDEFDTRSGGELGALALSFNRLRRSMESAMALVKS